MLDFELKREKHRNLKKKTVVGKIQVRKAFKTDDVSFVKC